MGYKIKSKGGVVLTAEEYRKEFTTLIENLDEYGIMTVIMAIAKIGKKPLIEYENTKHGREYTAVFSQFRGTTSVNYNYTKYIFDVKVEDVTYSYPTNENEEIDFTNRLLDRFVPNRISYSDAAKLIRSILGIEFDLRPIFRFGSIYRSDYEKVYGIANLISDAIYNSIVKNFKP